MKKNLGIIIAIFIALLACVVFGVLIFRPSLEQSISNYLTGLKEENRPIVSGEVVTPRVEPIKKDTEGKDGGPSCGGLKGGCANGGVESTGAEVNPSASSDEKVLDTGMTEKEILARIAETTKNQLKEDQNSTGSIVQGNYSAEVIYNKKGSPEKIKVNISGRELLTALPRETIDKNTKFQTQYDPTQCTKDDCDAGGYPKYQIHLNGFFNDGKYLKYNISASEGGETVFLNTKTGEIVYDTPGSFTCQIMNDNIACSMGYGPESIDIVNLDNPQKGNSILSTENEQIQDFFIDTKYAYIQFEGNQKLIRIYDLKTLKEVYSKELK